ncbi:MAG: PhnD/SsuA/transferrin family substrate-binding protein [Patescibacteria group bacterium]
MFKNKILFLFFSLLVLFPVIARGEALPVVKIGVLDNQNDLKKTAEMWQATADYLNSEIKDYTFQIVPLTFQDVLPVSRSQGVSFVLTNSSIYVQLELLLGASRIATLRALNAGVESSQFGSVIVTRSDRKDIKELKDLRGKTVAAVETTSFGGWQAAYKEFIDYGIDPFADFKELKFLGAQNKVVEEVLAGKYDAGVARTGVLEQLIADKKIKNTDFYIINDYSKKIINDPEYFNFFRSTKLYPEWALSKLSNVDDNLSRKIAGALFKIEQNSAPANSAKIAGFTTPLNYQSVHDLLMALKLNPYENYGEMDLGELVSQYFWPIIIGLILILLIIASLFFSLSVSRRHENNLYFMETLIESIPSPLFYKNSKGVYLGCNSAYLNLIGKKKNEVVGRYIHDIYRDKSLAEKYHQDDINALESYGTRSYEGKFPASDNTLHDVIFHKAAYKDINGKVIGLVGVITDITEIKKIESTLMERNSGLEKLNELMVGRELKMTELKKVIKRVDIASK